MGLGDDSAGSHRFTIIIQYLGFILGSIFLGRENRLGINLHGSSSIIAFKPMNMTIREYIRHAITAHCDAITSNSTVTHAFSFFWLEIISRRRWKEI